MKNPSLLSPSTLAFMGDAVYGILARQMLCETERPIGELHKKSVEIVNATAQARAFTLIEPMLIEKEIGVFKRGRNMHTSNTPKNSSVAQYHCATGLETLFGYLYLCNNMQRATELFSVIWKDYMGQ